jgi:hypothetical protein
MKSDVRARAGGSACDRQPPSGHPSCEPLLAEGNRLDSDQIRKILSSCPPAELDRLTTGLDCTLALAAGWERVCRTLPSHEQDEAIGLNEQAVSRFMALLKWRLHTPIPEPWETSVKDARGHNQRHINFARPKIAYQSVIREDCRRLWGHWRSGLRRGFRQEDGRNPFQIQHGVL